MNDLGWTKPNNSEKGFNELSTKAIIKAARKYGARFVVTENQKLFPCRLSTKTINISSIKSSNHQVLLPKK